MGNMRIASLQLFEILSKLKEKVLYYDTDSVIYISKIGVDESIQLDDYLGMLTNELDFSKWITKFCSTGPKCYAYQTNKEEAKDKFSFTTLQ